MFHHNPGTRASQAQLDLLARMGVSHHSWLNAYQADKLIKQNEDKWAQLPPTEKQVKFLTNRGRWRPGMLGKEASELIARIVDHTEELERFVVRPAVKERDDPTTGPSPSSNKGPNVWDVIRRDCEDRRD